MVKDIEYAFFSQLSYLNWNNISIDIVKEIPEYQNKFFINFLRNNDIWNNIRIDNLEPKVENGILMYDEADKRLFGVFGIERNEENTKLMNPYYDFNGWQFIYSADSVKLFKERYNLEVEDNGFFACAFLKENDIVIAYRGTEPDSIEDLLADLEIGFLNHSHSQLVCAYLFLEHVKSLYPGRRINITGHSLGGCLAQYAFVCTGKKYPTVTWNALGVGKHKNEVTENIFWGNDITKYLKVYSYDIKKKLEKLLLPNGKIIEDFSKLSENEMIAKILQEIYTPTKETIETGYYKVAEKEIKGIKVSFGTMSSSHDRGNQNLSLEQERKLEKELKVSSIEIYWLLKGIKNYQSCFKSTSANIKNYYNSLDWTSLLQTREGETIDVLTGNQCEQENTDDTKWRVIKATFEKLGFSYHGVNDFLLYMDEKGMIKSGKYNEIFIKNLIKTIYEYVKPTNNYLKLEIFQENSIKYTDKEKPFQRFQILSTKKRTFLKNMTLIEEARVKYLSSAINSLPSNVMDYIPYSPFTLKPEENDEIGVYTIGQLSNVTLGGIKGGVESQLIKISSKKRQKEEKEYLNLEKINIDFTRKYYGINNN